MRAAHRLCVLLGLVALRPSDAVAETASPPSARTTTPKEPSPTKHGTRSRGGGGASLDDSQAADYRTVSALGLTSAYAAFGAWTWLAWYRDKPRLPAWRFGGDGGFGLDTYAGGADKLGHVWAALVLTRLGADLLEAGDWEPIPGSAVAAGLCIGALSLVEVNDGFYTEFSPGDLAADILGVGAALALRHVPQLDRALDFRVEWLPSREFRERPGANFAEDYAGQSYLLAFKSRALASLRNSDGPLYGLQFVNPVVGFEARNFVSVPNTGEHFMPRQTLFLGLTLDVQAMLDVALANSNGAGARVSAGVGRTLFEYVNLPLSTRRIASTSRHAGSQPAR